MSSFVVVGGPSPPATRVGSCVDVLTAVSSVPLVSSKTPSVDVAIRDLSRKKEMILSLSSG